MQLSPVPVFDRLDPTTFRKDYYGPQKPVVLRRLAEEWPAYRKWDWDYFKRLVGDQKVGLYNNIKSDAYTPINKADDYRTFGDYIDTIRNGPAGWRIFLFNIFDHAPQLVQDFNWPEDLMKGFVKKFPMLFVGGATSITHMHFDIDMSHILHTQFAGRKRVLLFPFEEQHKLYRKPFEVLSLADFSNYYNENSKLDYEQFPALKEARGYEVILEHGDTLFMPAGYWHHMEYLDSGFAMSLRALQPSLTGKLRGAWNLFGMRSIDTLMKKTAPMWWYERKKKLVFANAAKAM
ncbi:transcriptional regulator [Flaviaesturariibacter flavus]|uniref:Transcriptional regulator n=1 Tax=Flaviaesturariibacter flavus TaxID=2502780 RepID=A0A4R1B8A6_9BACT|nr:cupin-like domain-containing protein [Flaviaesturariibacter flavus]TCJ13118.1 transcriptional regulator [Flaviaesturariibacter flavus]